MKNGKLNTNTVKRRFRVTAKRPRDLFWKKFEIEADSADAVALRFPRGTRFLTRPVEVKSE